MRGGRRPTPSGKKVRSLLRDRFSRPLDPRAADYSSSVEEDQSLLVPDLVGSLAHLRMLWREGLIPDGDARKLHEGLTALYRRALEGRVKLDPALEDVHMNVEVALTSRAGPRAGARLHTGRSRNDQVATDLLLYLRESSWAVEAAAWRLVRTLLRQARGPAGRTTVLGRTHFQEAQRVHLGQVLLVHAHRFARDAQRAEALRRSLRHSPLGSAALAGSSLPLDRGSTARWLGFSGPNPNSMDAVSDRDPSAEALFLAALVGVHASSLAEELVLWSSPELRQVRLDDPFVTTSSLMPHKRNPDLAELARAEAGPLLGLLVAHLTVQKGLPLAYNRDLQALKPLLREGIRRTIRLLDLMEGMLATARFLPPGEGSPSPPATLTWSVEAVDALVRAGSPFREAHRQMAAFVKSLEGQDLPRDPRSWDRLLEERFPALAATGFRVPRPEEEPDLRRTMGGSHWSWVRRDARNLQAQAGAAARRIRRERLAWERKVRFLLEPLPPRTGRGSLPAEKR